MTTTSTLASDLARLGRETDMLDTIATMMGAERLAAATADGTPRRDVLARLADDGLALTGAVRSALSGPGAPTCVDSDPTAHPDATDVPARFRESARAFADVAVRLDELGPDTVVDYRGLALHPDEVVPQRIAEVVLANDAISSVWSLDEADPDSVRNALDAMVRRLDGRDDVPALTLVTVEGDQWLLSGGGRRIEGTRESLARWLATGDTDAVGSVPGLPVLPRWH
ncbi:hypothetical protein GCM10009624_11020 [Gordonia sinesedis]